MNGSDPGMDAVYVKAAGLRSVLRCTPFAGGQSMRRFKYDNLTAAAPQAARSDFLITGVRVETKSGHDHVTVWNRGACSGTLIVKEGDGMRVADLLTLDGNQWRGEPEREGA